MARSKNPFFVILSMIFLGVLIAVLARFSYSAYVIVQAGESLRAVPLNLLLVDVMGLHRFALYGAGGGAVLGVVLVLVDLVRYRGRAEDYTWKSRQVIKPFAEDEVKARRMEIGDQYLKEQSSKGRDDDKT